MSTAAHAAGWNRRWKRGLGLATPAAGQLPTQGATDPIGLTVEIFVNSAWTDISRFVYYRDGSAMVGISRGRADETSQVQPQTCTLTLNNRDGRFSPRNPTGPYYGSIGRNTAIRVSRTWNGIRWYRFCGEVPAWPTTSDISNTDIYTSITAAGPLRRLNQGTPPAPSAMRRNISSPVRLGEANVVAYWPLEDGANSTRFASAISGAAAMLQTTAGDTPASDSSWVASSPLVVMNGGVLTGAVPTYTATGVTNVRWEMIIPAALAGTRNLVTLYTNGTAAKWLLQGNGSGQLELFAYDQSGTQILDSGLVNFGVTGKNTAGGLQFTQSGANIVWNILTIDISQTTYTGGSSTLSSGGTLTGKTMGSVTSVVLGDSLGLGSTAFGHVAIGNQIDAFSSTGNALIANLGEPVFTPDAVRIGTGEFNGGRFVRLCDEQGVNGSEIYGNVYTNDDTTMGNQLPSSFVSLLQECADSDLSLLYEPRDQVGVALRSRLSLYNQSAKVTLDYAQGQLAAQLEPHDDDTFTRNDITVQRVNGSSSVQQQATGTLNLQQPPAGVGDYATSVSISLGADAQTNDQAGWRLHIGTADQPRFPTISLKLSNAQFTGNTALLSSVLSMDIGDRLVVNNPPSWLPPDPISQIVQGYQESLGIWEHDITVNCSPEDPYHIAVLDDPVLAAADTDGSTLAANYPLGSETSISVATTNASSPLWTTTAADFPFDINVGGERMTVTNITGSSSPQTFTVTRSVNTVVKAQTTGTDVRLWQPMILSL